ncbi:hypothetical protein I4I84_31750 [Pseudonocardia sp. KRD-182]|uniref:pyruvate formate lyase family protein n=1 Tax=Pseudonocardia oceani TaxID=2792013 RepID=UPI001C4A6699|nr:pyruvate formate lyase family protein [Pseudonocardia oceani]MBW0113281.1 hypothetical protein [Pseudonocardia oceani]
MIVGLQTDAPLKWAIMPALATYCSEVDPRVDEILTKYRRTHKTVYSTPTPRRSTRLARSRIINGLPDSYGHARIIGDHRRATVYGVDRLVDDKYLVKGSHAAFPAGEDVIRDCEDLAEQIR